MTTKEFNETAFKKGMKVKIEGKIHELIGVDFDLMLFGISINNNLELDWHEISKCELLSQEVV
jgi:hypothetical protein